MKNFIDYRLADLLLKILPTSKQENLTLLKKYNEFLKFNEDLCDRSYILYKIGKIYSNIGDYSKALEYYHQALELNSRLPQALERIAVIYRYLGTKASEKREFSLAKKSFEIAISYLIEGQEAIKLAPNNYIEAQNWLKVTGKVSENY